MLSCWKRTDAPRRENRAVRTTRLPPDGRCDAHRENTKLPKCSAVCTFYSPCLLYNCSRNGYTCLPSP